MHKVNFHSEPITPKLHKNEKTKLSHSAKNLSLSQIDREALQIFNQVTANKNRILTKNSKGFYTKTTVKSKKFDSNGEEIIEKFEATSFGGITNEGEKLAELVQKYYNEKSGTEKTSVQRILGNRLRRIEVKKTLDSESTREWVENLDSEFEKEWKIGARTLGVKRVVLFDVKVCEGL